MIRVEEALIDSVTEAFYRLRKGEIPSPIPIPEDLPDNEVRQLITFVNRFIVEFSPFAEAMEQISRGELNTRPLLGGMSIVNSFKSLRSNLMHLTWKTQQIAGGDLEQKIDFMGDFSSAFNSMTQQLKASYEQLIKLNKELERLNRFIRKTFGRYTSNEIVEALLDDPDGLKLGGEKREVTLLMSDLRGFTSLVEQNEPTEVVTLLNNYLSAMVEIIQQRGGTIDEIIGDAILVIFGAPFAMDDAGQRAVRCALEMQKEMGRVNAFNHQKDLPEIEMGIALHTGDVVVGNIGSMKRTKYGVVGQAVNLTARMESFTLGGQIIVSPDLIKAAGQNLVLGGTVEVHAKGMQKALMCRELLGHKEYPDLLSEAEETICPTLAEPIPVHYAELTDKHFDKDIRPATLVGLSQRQAIVEAAHPLSCYTNIMLRLEPEKGQEDPSELYAKVIRVLDESLNQYLIHFTSFARGVKERLLRLTEP